MEARFLQPTAGSVWFRSLAVGDQVVTTIFTNLFDVENNRPKSSNNDWQIFTTDVLEPKEGKSQLFKLRFPTVQTFRFW